MVLTVKINIILSSIGNSGGINVIYKYVDLLVKEGNDVIVYKEVFLPDMHRYKSQLINKAHQVYRILKVVPEIFKHSHKHDRFVSHIDDSHIREADVTIATTWVTAFKVNQLSISKGKKFYFIQGFEVWDNEELGKQSYRLPLNKIVVSSWINNQLKMNLDMGPFPIVYNGLDLDIYHEVDCEKKVDGRINFLMLNHRLPQKGVIQGLKVFEEVQKKYPKSHLIMFGLEEADKLPDYVEYHKAPSQNELVNLYSKSDIFIFPSLEEGWGLTPIEAMACGCVVVGTKTGFVLDLGVHEKNMMISKPDDIVEMVSNIEKIIKEPDLYNQLKTNGIQTVKNLQWEKSVEKLLLLFNGGEE